MCVCLYSGVLYYGPLEATRFFLGGDMVIPTHAQGWEFVFFQCPASMATNIMKRSSRQVERRPPTSDCNIGVIGSVGRPGSEAGAVSLKSTQPDTTALSVCPPYCIYCTADRRGVAQLDQYAESVQSRVVSRAAAIKAS